MLFEWDLARQQPAQIEHNFWKTARAEESTRTFAEKLFEGAVGYCETADTLIETLSSNWRIERLAVVDRNILRLALYEMWSASAPPRVILDEAIELAKKFSSAESPAFLNGILDAALRAAPSAPKI